jgi:heterodisulfide reductase subunit C
MLGGDRVGFFDRDRQKHKTLASAWVIPAPGRCVQCGVCSFHCPMEIDVRRHVWLGEPVHDSHCLTCGECVERCPRGLLRFRPIGAVEPLADRAGAGGAAGPEAAAERELAKAART